MADILMFPTRPVPRSKTFSRAERDTLRACAEATGGGREGGALWILFRQRDDGNEAAVFVDGLLGSGCLVVLTVISHEGALALMLPSGEVVGPFEDVAGVVQGVHERLGFRLVQTGVKRL